MCLRPVILSREKQGVNNFIIRGAKVTIDLKRIKLLAFIEVKSLLLIFDFSS